jgi:hypothetical protein
MANKNSRLYDIPTIKRHLPYVPAIPTIQGVYPNIIYCIILPALRATATFELLGGLGFSSSSGKQPLLNYSSSGSDNVKFVNSKLITPTVSTSLFFIS